MINVKSTRVPFDGQSPRWVSADHIDPSGDGTQTIRTYMLLAGGDTLAELWEDEVRSLIAFYYERTRSKLEALRQDAQELLDIFIEGGYTEPEDEALINRLYAQLEDLNNA